MCKYPRFTHTKFEHARASTGQGPAGSPRAGGNPARDVGSVLVDTSSRSVQADHYARPDRSTANGLRQLIGSLKAVRDGVADALSLDDGDPRLTWEYRQETGPFGVRIYLEI